MQILNNLYPYPVLSEGDVTYNQSSSFFVEYKLIPPTPFKNAKISAKFNIIDNKIQQLIKEDAAGLFIHVESPRAAYRKIYEISDGCYELEIDPKFMRTAVEITGLVLATVPQSNLKNESVNEELYGSNYIFPKIEIGDPLAVSLTRIVNIEETNDFTQVSSIIKVATTTEPLMRVDYDQDTIFVYLPEEQYNKYLEYPNKFGEVMLNSIIYPALIYVLDAISKNYGEGMQDRKWYRVIEKKVEMLGYSMNQVFNQEIDSITLSQEILKGPLERMFLELEGVINDTI